MTAVMPGNYPLSMFSGLGFLALIGVLVNDALVLVSSYNEGLAAGRPQMEALREACRGRFRPILLTTVTTLAGLGPIMFEKSLQAQFLIPMAISLSYGLLATTVCLLVVLPALLILSNRFKVVTHRLVTGWRGSYADVEAAAPANPTRNWGLYLGGVAVVIAVLIVLQAAPELFGSLRGD